MNSISQNNLSGGVTDTPLMLAQPYNLIVFLTFYSPIIVAVVIVAMSFIFQNFKGFIYLGFLLGVSVLREFIFMITGAPAMTPGKNICTMVQYSKYGNSAFSVFTLAFTIMYICLPMIINNDVNWWVIGALLSYLFMDIGIRYTKQCITGFSDLLINLLGGATLGLIIPSLMYTGGASKYLFFNEISSNKEVCSMAKKQTFKCAVYKNGELIGSVNK
jgi:hypothetical protein